MLEFEQPTIFELQWLVSLLLFFILALLHEYAGYDAYIKGSNIGVFKSNPHWIPETSKELTLLGVFFMITFAWIGTILLTSLALLLNNPFGIWLGIIYLISVVPQLILLQIYVRWNKVAKVVTTLNILSTILWMFSTVL